MLPLETPRIARQLANLIYSYYYKIPSDDPIFDYDSYGERGVWFYVFRNPISLVFVACKHCPDYPELKHHCFFLPLSAGVPEVTKIAENLMTLFPEPPLPDEL